jgi:hypothetical protein
VTGEKGPDGWPAPWLPKDASLLRGSPSFRRPTGAIVGLRANLDQVFVRPTSDHYEPSRFAVERLSTYRPRARIRSRLIPLAEDSIVLKDLRARSALPSWARPITTLRMTMARIASASTRSPSLMSGAGLLVVQW